VTYLLAYVEEAVAALWRHRLRSMLTMLGMIIGSASIIAVFGISKAATSGISATFSSFGQWPIVILPDPSQDDPSQAAIQYRDLAAVTAALGYAAASVQPAWNRTLPVSFGSKRDYISVSPDGSYHTDALLMSEGRKISASDVAGAARVCVITADVAREFFGNSTALGNYLRISGGRCEVVGVYADIKGSFMNSLAGSSSVILPYTTYHNEVAPGSLDFLLIYPADPLTADSVGKTAITVLQHFHGARTKYVAQNTADQLQAFETVLRVIGIGLSAIGGVALLVAGIGIMNIMLVSVTERTREIGIRKAVGANRGNIATQFIMESIVLSLLGGGVGMAVGLAATLGAANLLSRQLGEILIPYLLIGCIALGFSIAVGMLFGIYPALRAARLNPIEALRS
jgi:putative ABC transport system permease protein